MALKQITVRPTEEEFSAFENWRETNEGLSESQALCELVRRYFEGGNRRELEHRLNSLQQKLNSLLEN